MEPVKQPGERTLDRHSFLVRIWRGSGPSPWQGWAQHVQSGTSVAFVSLEELLDFLQSWVLDPPQKKGQGLK